jgi:hypothetical protein
LSADSDFATNMSNAAWYSNDSRMAGTHAVEVLLMTHFYLMGDPGHKH